MTTVADPIYEETEPMVSVFPEQADHPVFLPVSPVRLEQQPATTNTAHTPLVRLLRTKQLQRSFKIDIIAVWLAIPLLFGFITSFWFAFH